MASSINDVDSTFICGFLSLMWLVDRMKKEWLALGLLLILIGLALLYFSNTLEYQDNYGSKASLDNSVNYSEGRPTQLSLTAYFEAGQRFFFNFSKGRYWGVAYDQANGMEPGDPNFAPGASIEPYKTVEFSLSTPSGDVVLSEVYMVEGSEAFAVTYLNQSADFVPLLGGNLSFVNVGMEGIIERTGNYSVKAVDIAPPVMKDAGAANTYEISGDPPLGMYLWNVETVEARPYFVSSVSAGGVLLVVGVVLSAWAGRPKKSRRASNSRKARRKK